MNKEEAGSAFAPATGYATAVDAALNAPKYGTHLLGGVHYFAEWHHFDALRDEVRRLRAIVSECADEIEPPPEWWRDEPRCGYSERFKARMELRIKCVAVRESHNRGFSNAEGYQPKQPESRSDG